MKYKVFTYADLGCPFRTDNNIPDKYKTEAAAKAFCPPGCSVICAPEFWCVRVLRMDKEKEVPFPDFTRLVMNHDRILLLPLERRK